MHRDMYKKKKQVEASEDQHTNMPDQDMDIRRIMKDIEKFSASHMTWKEKKEMENRKVVSLGGKPPKKQRLPLSVARPMMKRQKQREEKILQENLVLSRFERRVGSTNKKPVKKRKPEERALKSSEGRFRNGVLDVRHMLKSSHTRNKDTVTNAFPVDNFGIPNGRKGGKGKKGKTSGKKR